MRDPIDLTTLYERQPDRPESLTPELAALYRGELAFPRDLPGGRPWVVANFVESLDGVISYDEPGKLGGGPISGENETDHFVMGLLRSLADAVIFGSGALRGDSGHVRVPAFVYPALAREYADLRVRLGLREPLPLNVIVSASGDVDLREPTFSYPGLRSIIVTTATGARRLSAERVPEATDLRIVEDAPLANGDIGVSPDAVLALIHAEYGVRVALYEGGPRLFGSFLGARLIDELFLTLAPQIAGRAQGNRPALVAGLAFAPSAAPWATLRSVRQAGSHLLLRYRLAPERASISGT